MEIQKVQLKLLSGIFSIVSSVKDRSLQDIFPILNKVIPTDIHMSSPSTMQGKTEKK